MDDLAAACVYLMQHYESKELVNIGCGEDVSTTELATIVSEVVQYKGETQYDPTMSDGAPRKLLDISRSKALGWSSTVPLREGIASTYQWFLQNPGAVRS